MKEWNTVYTNTATTKTIHESGITNTDELRFSKPYLGKIFFTSGTNEKTVSTLSVGPYKSDATALSVLETSKKLFAYLEVVPKTSLVPDSTMSLSEFTNTLKPVRLDNFQFPE